MSFSKLIRKIPPFKSLYMQIDNLKEENAQLVKNIKKLEKHCEYIFSVEQRYETNMNEHYENLKEELRSNKSQVDARHQDVIMRIQKNQEAVVEYVQNRQGEIVEKHNESYSKLRGEISKVRNQLSKDIQYYYFKGLHPDQYEENLTEWYRGRTGEELDLEHPTTYNEKIQWMKLYDSTLTKADLADKYKVREYVKEKIGEDYLIPLLGVWKNEEDVPFEQLPERFVLKANHGCGYNIIVRDKDQLDVEAAKGKLKKWLKTNFAYSAGLELHYKMIEPMVIAEEYIENLNGDLNDYKVFCFNGKATYIMFLKDRQTKLKMAFYDTEWNRMPFVYSHERLLEDIPKPDNLDELIQISEKLAEGFPHVRVDFYRLNTGEYRFGELTFTSFSGACIWDPPEYNQILGDLIELPKK